MREAEGTIPVDRRERKEMTSVVYSSDVISRATDVISPSN